LPRSRSPPARTDDEPALGERGASVSMRRSKASGVWLADIAIVTSDNPRTEDPEKILDDVEVGMRAKPHTREATAAAPSPTRYTWHDRATPFLLAGKGHETYQVIGTEKQPFDERAIVKELGAS